ncbi:ORF6N domain-containing protein [Lactiplantibacillus plantarum]
MQEVQQVKFNGDLILSTEQLAEFYGTTSQRIKQNFANNRSKFVKGKLLPVDRGNSKRVQRQGRNFRPCWEERQNTNSLDKAWC